MLLSLRGSAAEMNYTVAASPAFKLQGLYIERLFYIRMVITVAGQHTHRRSTPMLHAVKIVL